MWIGFDCDWTLIRPKTRRIFFAHDSTGADDWEWLTPPDYVAQLAVELDCHIWIGSNQRWPDAARVDAAVARLEAMARAIRGEIVKLGGDQLVCYTVGRRNPPHQCKPFPGFRPEFVDQLLFYCGDADGVYSSRNTDALFARNARARFLPLHYLRGTPVEVAQRCDSMYAADGSMLPARLPRYDELVYTMTGPSAVDAAARAPVARVFARVMYALFAGRGPLTVVMAGAPGSGKSRLAHYLRGHCWKPCSEINEFSTQREIRETRTLAEKTVHDGERRLFVCDHTHPDAEARRRAALTPRLFLCYFTNKAVSAELNQRRVYETGGARNVPAVAENMFWKRCDFQKTAPPDLREYVGAVAVTGLVDYGDPKKHLRFV